MNQESISIQEAWNAAGGNPGIAPTKEDLIVALQAMDEAEDWQEQRIAELEAALAPFAALSQPHQSDCRDTDPCFGINDATLTYGEVRGAAKVLEGKSPTHGGWNLISRRGLPVNNPLNDANTVEVEIFDSTLNQNPRYWVCSAVFWHSTEMWHIVGGGATTAATHWRYKTYPVGTTTLPIGTPVRFTKNLTNAACGDHPGMLFARAGEQGLITGHGTPEGYWVKSNQHPNSFGASPAEFEVIA